jgi:hypothetical protein
MSDQAPDIRIDDLILFFRQMGSDGKEIVANRLISHDTYTADQLKVPDDEIQPAWKDAVVSEPSTSDAGKSFVVANLSRLVPPDDLSVKRKRKQVAVPASVTKSPIGAGDLLLFPPENAEVCFRVPRSLYEDEQVCPSLSKDDIPDLDFMATQEGVVLANVPKITPQGCTCILLSLVSLRSGMLGDKKADKSAHAKHMSEAMQRGYAARKPEPKP